MNSSAHQLFYFWSFLTDFFTVNSFLKLKVDIILVSQFLSLFYVGIKRTHTRVNEKNLSILLSFALVLFFFLSIHPSIIHPLIYPSIHLPHLSFDPLFLFIFVMICSFLDVIKGQIAIKIDYRNLLPKGKPVKTKQERALCNQYTLYKEKIHILPLLTNLRISETRLVETMKHTFSHLVNIDINWGLCNVLKLISFLMCKCTARKEWYDRKVDFFLSCSHLWLEIWDMGNVGWLSDGLCNDLLRCLPKVPVWHIWNHTV